MSVDPKQQLGSTKPDLSVVPAVGTIWVAMAMRFGAYGLDVNGRQVRPKGYGPFNWRRTTVKASTYLRAIERHVARIKDGGVKAEADDSGVYDLAHLAACCFILLDAMESGCLDYDIDSADGVAGALLDRLTIQPEPKAEHSDPLIERIGPHLDDIRTRSAAEFDSAFNDLISYCGVEEKRGGARSSRSADRKVGVKKSSPKGAPKGAASGSIQKRRKP